MGENAKEKVGQWLSTASQILGVKAELSEDGACSLLIGNDLVISIQVPDEGDWFCLYTPLGEIPKDNMEESFLIFQKALELNAFQGASRGGAIGMIPDEPILVYTITRSTIGCDEQIFAETIALFYDTSLDLRNILELKPFLH